MTCSKHKKHISFWLIFLFLSILGMNGISFMHAYRLTHFVGEGETTKRPEDLTLYEKFTVLLTGVKVPKPRNRITPEQYGYTYTAVTHLGADKLETPVWEISAPQAQYTLILFHGFSSNKGDLLPLAKMFLRHHPSIKLFLNICPFSFYVMGFEVPSSPMTSGNARIS